MKSTISIDPNLSVYHLVQRTKEQLTLLNHRRTMSLISYEIENAILLHNVRARLFAGFQRMSRFIPQIPRYTIMAQNAESIYVFGVMDVQPPPIANIRYIPLTEAHQLSKEWFVVADARDYFSALATEELSHIEDADDKRMFQGVWSFDEDIVTILQEWLSSLVNAHDLGNLSENRNYRSQMKIMSSTMGRMAGRLAKSFEKPTTTTPNAVQGEVDTAVEQQLSPSILKIEDKLNE
ncbi:MAG: DICT sensory domain-containing protein [Chloroflexota bacterium]